MTDKMDQGFERSVPISTSLKRAARVAIDKVLKAKRGEHVLIVANPNRDVQRISMALYDAALASGAQPAVVFQPVRSQLDFAHEAVISALGSQPEIVISISHEKLGKDRFAMRKSYKHRGKTLDHIFNYLLASKKARSFWSPSVTVEMFERTIPIDYRKLVENCRKLKKAFDGAVAAHLVTSKGTDLVIGLRGRRAFTDDGDFSKPGAGGNLPAGEMFISPELGAGEGTLVYDGCVSSDRGVILIKEPIRVTVRDNLVTDISGGREARLLDETLKRAHQTTLRFAAEGKIRRRDVSSYLRNIRNLGELGIGLNEKARIVGNMLEDEKVLRTCHIALGSNYDEDAKSLIHLDGLIRNPTIELQDGRGRVRLVMRKGSLLL